MTTIEVTLRQLALQRERLYYQFGLAALNARSALPVDSWAAAVDAKLAAGLSRVDAIRAASKERPDLYRQQVVLKRNYRRG